MYHVTQLKQFYYDTDKVNPVDIARQIIPYNIVMVMFAIRCHVSNIFNLHV